ncbi:MAG: carboxypeptidase regulatory-like domain-containing protein, partial [Pyrinomonadaceae bacterium]|nr:carboxypeptidase regulatory-like domain-containing protein [Pyrinomonadaceae bacterium]
MKPEKQSNHRQKFAFGALVTIFVGWFALFAISGFAQRTKTVTVNSNFNITNSTPESTSVVRGRAVYEDTGRAVRRTAISLLSIKGGGTKSAITDDNGAFEIKKVPAGEYMISVSAPGVISPLAYASFDKDVETSEGRESGLAEMTRFADKVSVDGISDADIFVRAKHGAAINGRVYYADGDPAIGVKIEILRKKDDKFSTVVTGFGAFAGPLGGGGSLGDKTDDRGMYRISGLPPGEYVVRVSESVNHKVNDDGNRTGDFLLLGFSSGSFLKTYHPDVLDVKEAKVLTLELGQEAGETNITLPVRSFYKITGRVIARGTKQPVKEAQMSITRDDDTSSFDNIIQKELQRVTTDEMGNWSYKELPAGKYIINVKPKETYDYDYGGTMSNANAAARKPKQPKPPKFASKQIEL